MRSIEYRLALLVAAITLAALGVVYLYVVPRLGTRLQDERLEALADAAEAYSGRLEGGALAADARGLDRAVRQAADLANARVTLLGVSRGDLGTQLFPISDSFDETSLQDYRFGTALRAARSGRPLTGTERTRLGLVGEAARPLRRTGDPETSRVVVFSAPLDDLAGDVDVIRNEVLVAGVIALVFAAGAGYLVASRLSRRVRRLEAAANRVAAGDFSARVEVDADDELGQLARAFDEMQRQLAQLDDARKRFIAIASHELRTPIFSLGGFVELLQDEDLDDETRERFLDQLRQGVDRLRKLATELLDLSRLEAGSLELRPERVDLAALARGVAEEFTPALARHDSHLEVRLARRGAPARCDRERVAQILRILVDNALTHTPEGTGIVVTAGGTEGRARITVTDDGPGIPPDAVTRIFDPFFSSEPQGSGLGLAIARELAERMRGRLVVDSRPGRTEFALELPA